MSQNCPQLVFMASGIDGYPLRALPLTLSGRRKLFVEFSKIVDGEFRSHCTNNLLY